MSTHRSISVQSVCLQQELIGRIHHGRGVLLHGGLEGEGIENDGIELVLSRGRHSGAIRFLLQQSDLVSMIPCISRAYHGLLALPDAHTRRPGCSATDEEVGSTKLAYFPLEPLDVSLLVVELAIVLLDSRALLRGPVKFLCSYVCACCNG
jgi:hypothetical protein